MVNKIIRLFILCLTVFFVGTAVATDAAENEEFEKIVLNGRTITYNYTGGAVYMPVEYVVDSSEMRGAWVATVWNNDMPKQHGTTEEAINAYKQAYLEVLDTLEKYNMNTIFFQIRPNNDAFYKSVHNDWSQFLVGAGVDPGWDPLEWMVEVTHEREIRFQCWMNAFRVTVEEQLEKDAINYTDEQLIAAKSAAIARLADNNFAKKHPELVVMGDYDSKLILNPAELAVQQHIIDTIEEIITNYDVDGFHFDDYFYLSGRSADGINPQKSNLCFAGGTSYKENLTGVNTMNDLGTYRDYLANPAKYDLEANLELGEFRRQSLNNMMKNIRKMVDRVNADLGKSVEFGSKPTAVWQSNKAYCQDSASAAEGGSNTHCGAYNSNYTLFADTKAWVENGYVDWIAPQVYYGFTSNEAPYADIVKWWAGVVNKTNEKRASEGKENVKMYVAHGIYKYHDNNGVDFSDSNEMVYQLRYNQVFDCIKGSAVYAYSDLVVFKNTQHQTGIGTKLYALWKQNPVLPFPEGELDYNNLKVGNISVRETVDPTMVDVSFDKVANASMYQIYLVPKGETLDLNNTKARYQIVKDYIYTDKVTLNLKIRDQFDYYINVVSDNYYPSNTATKIDMGNIEQNNAPEEVKINLSANEIQCKDYLYINVPYANDLDGDTLTYKFSASYDGIDGSFRYSLSNIVYGESGITAEYKGFGAKTENFVIKLEISDGIDTTVVYSTPVKFVDQVEEHKHEYVDGKCSCGEVDPNYQEHTHTFVDGECSCGEIDPNYQEHTHKFVDGVCSCGEKDPSATTKPGSGCAMGTYIIAALLPIALAFVFLKRKH